MKKVFKIAALLLTAVLFNGCGDGEKVGASVPAQSTSQSVNERTDEAVKTKVKMVINGREYNVRLENNETAHEFAKLLPLEISMTELNGNEKYCRLKKSLPSDDRRPEEIHTGDMMLYNRNCVVLFYKDFTTSYSYTGIGRIENADGLVQTVGSGDIRAILIAD